MQLTVLVDNNTLIDRYLVGEPGVSYLIEHDGQKILFDTGYSDVFLQNAQTLQIDLTTIDSIVLSHGHNDHTWGLNHLTQHYDRLNFTPERKINLVCHPDALNPKYFDAKSIGINYIYRGRLIQRPHLLIRIEPFTQRSQPGIWLLAADFGEDRRQHQFSFMKVGPLRRLQRKRIVHQPDHHRRPGARVQLQIILTAHHIASPYLIGCDILSRRDATYCQNDYSCHQTFPTPFSPEGALFFCHCYYLPASCCRREFRATHLKKSRLIVCIFFNSRQR